jgi:hypothetical protein
MFFLFFKTPGDHKTQTSQALRMHFLRNFLDKGLGSQHPLNYEIEKANFKLSRAATIFYLKTATIILL